MKYSKKRQKKTLKTVQKNSLISDQIGEIKYLPSIALILSIVMIFFCLRSAYTTYLLPIYGDEISMRYELSRIVYDFPIKTNQLPMCHSPVNTANYAKLWYFPAFMEWLVHGQIFDIKAFRFIGVITGWLVLLLLSFRLCYQNIKFFNPFYKKIILFVLALGCVLSLMEIGVVPFDLVSLRPEQSILLLLIILLLIFSTPAETLFKKIALTLSYFICVCILFYIHGKTFFLLPALIIIACKVFSLFKNTYIIILLLFLLCTLAIGNYYLWVTYFDCSNSPDLNALLKTMNVDLHNILYKPSLFFSEIWNNLSRYHINMERIGFEADPHYIPAINIDEKIHIVNGIIYVNYATIFILLFIASMVSCVLDLRKKNYLTNNVLAFALFLSTIINLLMNKYKHFYDSGYLWALLVVTLFFYISPFIPYLSKRKMTYIVMSYFLCVGILSQSIFMGVFEAPLINGWSGAFISISQYQHKEINEELDELSALCHIDKNKSHNLILDDLTYLHFQRSKYPLAYTFLFYNTDREFLHGFWNKFDIDGMVLRKFTIHEQFRAKYGIEGRTFVCIPKKNIAPLFEEMFTAYGL